MPVNFRLLAMASSKAKHRSSFRLMGIPTILAIFLPSVATASGWDCSNQDMEITCTAGRCSNSAAFTPLQVTLTDKGKLSVCAYSGCWQGKGRVVSSSRYLFVSASQLQWIGVQPGQESFALVLDRQDRTALLKGGGFALPMLCVKQK